MPTTNAASISAKRTLTNLKALKKPGKITKGLASQVIAALACVGGWSDTANFKYLATQPGAAEWLTQIPASTSDIRLLLRNCLTGGSSCGIMLAEALGQDDGDRTQHAVIAGYTVATVLVLISSAGFALTHLFLRPLFPEEEELAKASNAYFDWGQLGNAPAVWITPMTQIALMCGALKSAVFANLLFRLSIPALSYCFVVQMKMGATGIDLANGIAPWTGYLFLLACMHWGNSFADLRQWSFKNDFIEANRKEFKGQFWKGLLMMTQRATEYFNLALLGALLGHLNKINLVKINPFLQTSPFCTLAALGLGMMGNMDTREKHAALLAAKEKAKRSEPGALESCEKLDRELRVIIGKTFLSGTIVNVALMLLLIFLRNQFTRIFIASNTAPDVMDDSSFASMVNAFGLVPDAWRIIGSNLLNTYDKIVTPNAISLFFMTFLGIGPMWIYTSVTHKDVFMGMFWMRNAMMLVSGAAIIKILYNCVNADTTEIAALRRLAQSAAESREQVAVAIPTDAEANTPSGFEKFKNYFFKSKAEKKPLLAASLLADERSPRAATST